MPQQEYPYDTELSGGSSIASTASSSRLSRIYSFSSNNTSDNESGRNEARIPDIQIDPIVHQPSTPIVYEPIVVPAEPSLEELLRQVSGTEELHKVTDIQLRVISYTLSLHRLPLFCPNLRALNLDGSVVTSLRDLGTDLSMLKYLNVSRCGLRNLDGTNGLTALEELVADNNDIDDAGPCNNLPMIKKISLRGNRIETVSAITFLGLCDSLSNLNMSENPVCETENYRDAVKRCIPQLTCLDGVSFNPETANNSDLSSSEYKSSSSSEDQQPKWKPVEEVQPAMKTVWVPKERPGTGEQQQRVALQLLDRTRPATADKPKMNLLSGEPLAGNIFTGLRRARHMRTAWASNGSTTSISSTDSSECGTKKPPRPRREPNSSKFLGKEFPQRIEQESVDLELGLLVDQKEDEMKDENVDILEMARMWRRRSQQTRTEIKMVDDARALMSD